MKKIFLITVLFLYLIPSIGITVSAHYCRGELSGISFGAEKQKQCGCKVGAVRKNCCQDVVLSMKIKDDQQKITPVSFKLVQPEALPSKPDFTYQLVIRSVEQPTVIYPVEIPPGRFKQPLYLQNESFLI
jgi:hypothetical protein